MKRSVAVTKGIVAGMLVVGCACSTDVGERYDAPKAPEVLSVVGKRVTLSIASDADSSGGQLVCYRGRADFQTSASATQIGAMVPGVSTFELDYDLTEPEKLVVRCARQGEFAESDLSEAAVVDLYPAPTPTTREANGTVVTLDWDADPTLKYVVTVFNGSDWVDATEDLLEAGPASVDVSVFSSRCSNVGACSVPVTVDAVRGVFRSRSTSEASAMTILPMAPTVQNASVSEGGNAVLVQVTGQPLDAFDSGEFEVYAGTSPETGERLELDEASGRYIHRGFAYFTEDGRERNLSYVARTKITDEGATATSPTSSFTFAPDWNQRFSNDTGGTVANLQVVDDRVYWYRAGKKLVSRALSALPSTEQVRDVASNLPGPSHLRVDAADADVVFFTDIAAGLVGVVKQSGNDIVGSAYIQETAESPASGLWVTANDIYVAHGKKLFHISRASLTSTGLAMEPLVTATDPVTGVAVSGTTLFFATATGVWSHATEPSADAPVEVTRAFGATSLLVDGTTLYLAATRANGAGSIESIDTATQPAVPVTEVPHLVAPSHLSKVGDRLYFVAGGKLASIGADESVPTFIHAADTYAVTLVDGEAVAFAARAGKLYRLPHRFGQSPSSPPEEGPTELVATGREGRVELTWVYAKGATHYEVAIGDDTEPTVVVSSQHSDISAVIDGLANGVPVDFVVTAANALGRGGSATVTGTPSPDAPTLAISGHPASGSLTVTASYRNPVARDLKIRVYTGLEPDQAFSQMTLAATRSISASDPEGEAGENVTAEVTLEGLDDGTVYFLRAVLEENGATSVPSAEVSAMPWAPWPLRSDAAPTHSTAFATSLDASTVYWASNGVFQWDVDGETASDTGQGAGVSAATGMTGGLMYGVRGGYPGEVVSIDVAMSQTQSLDLGGAETLYTPTSIATDGGKLYVSDNSGLVSMGLDGTNATRNYEGGATDEVRLQFEQIFFREKNGGAWHLRVLAAPGGTPSGTPVTLASNIGASLSSYAVRAGLAYYIANSKLWSVSTTGGVPTELAEGARGPLAVDTTGRVHFIAQTPEGHRSFVALESDGTLTPQRHGQPNGNQAPNGLWFVGAEAWVSADGYLYAYPVVP